MRQKFRARGKRLAGVASAAVLAVPLLVLAPAAAASADPGFCGVRADGPTPIDGGDVPYFAYQVHNKCSRAHAFKVYFPQLGRSTLCRSVDPYGNHTYAYAIDTDWWEVRSC
ncbi:hypothetical protein LO771_10885 [Streptacidiphilus sp. ASG 303]|uniref:hypothetical protein n=1 Tax=Streptacidiphilus sp. ASG 303 TaxID=2896847 RepID=UPI001E2C0D49|nr:hypothetical protein [Streptacidiphilus sp. ASG 303]MCD0482891.1 hypothetical protein [Streptacidiphilus sp. ASG 303]